MMINEIITFLGKIKMTDWIAIIALIVSLISLITSFFHPEIRRWMKRKFMSNKLNFIAIDNLILFFNQGGSFIRLSVTLQPPNDAMTIKNIAVEIKRNKTKECRTLTWSAFLPLISQSVGVVQIDTFSEAVPERILQDDIKTFKLEFSDTDNQRKSKLNRLVTSAASTVAKLDISKDVKELKQELKQHPEIISWHSELSEDFFWKEGEYSLKIIVRDSTEKIYEKTIEFCITTEEYKSFRKNLDEFFACEINKLKNLPSSFFTASKNFANDTLKDHNRQLS